MANTKLPARLLDTSAVPALNVTGDLIVDTTTLKVDASSNRIGIGTASPGSLLTVEGDIRQTAGDFLYGGGGNWDIKHLADNQNIVFYTSESGSATEKLRIKANGNIGIGETSPDKQLHIKSTATGDTGIVIENTNNAQNLDIDFYNNVGSAQGRIRYAEGAGSFDINPNVSGTSSFTILYDGKVGIGETSPLGKLHIKEDDSGVSSINSNFDQLVLEDDLHAGMSILSGTSGDGAIYFGDSGTNDIGQIKYRHASDRLDFTTNSAIAMMITSQGTFGMGPGTGNLAGSIIINNDGLCGTLNNAYYNTVLGYEAADDLTSGDSNTIMGNQAGYKLTEATGNTLIGRLAGEQLTTGSYNTAIGFNTMGDAVVTGASNTAVGNSVMVAVTSGAGNTAVGEASAAGLTTGSNNVAIGRSAMSSNTVTGNYNVGIGYETLKGITSGSENMCIGRDAGHDINTANQCVAIGHESLTKNQSAGGNTAVGFQALENAYAASNTAVGYKAGENVTSGTNNLTLGKEAGTSGSPSGAISSGSNTICLGDNNIGNLYCTQSSINTSDRRDKADITNFTDGLEFIKKMQPVTYKWDRRSWYLPRDEEGNITDDDITKVTQDGSKKEDITHVGFIAQDVETLEKEIGFANDNTDRLLTNLTEDGNSYGMKYDRLVTLLVNAVKDLSTELEDAKARIETLEG